jgi:serine/threonine-protein kinase
MTIDVPWLQLQFPELHNLAVLGGGGFKIVFSATHATEGAVVLKLIHPAQDPESTRRELLASRRMQPCRVPQIFGDGILSSQVGHFVWIREQRIVGETLRQTLRRGALAPLLVLKVGLQVLECLERAEQIGIVHRDIKPDNIVCSQPGDFWVIDFGIARHLRLDSATATAMPFGKFTTGYAPVEQFRNVKTEIDTRADLFALGVTLVECATGLHPFRHPPSNDLEILNRVENLVVPPLQLNIPGTDQFRDLVHTMLQKRRDLRPRTVSEALQWIRDIWNLQSR